MKTCFKCKKTKELSEFYEHPRMRDGHLNKCKECAKADVRCNRVRRIDYYLKYEKCRNGTPNRRALRREALRRRDPVKRAANVAVSNALRDGRLVRQPCQVCGAPKAEAHHDDYTKPLQVRWLCFKHHRELHGNRHFSVDLVGAQKGHQ